MIATSLTLLDRFSIVAGDFIGKNGLLWFLAGSLALFAALTYMIPEYVKFSLNETLFIDAEITSYRITNTTVNDEELVAYDYAYTFNGTPYTGSSRSLWDYDKGEIVEIEVIADMPEMARLVGTRTPILRIYFTVGALIATVFGLTLLVWAIIALKRVPMILKDASLIKGERFGIKKSWLAVNDKKICQLQYQYIIDKTEYQTSVITMSPDSWKHYEKIIYSNQDPSNAVLLDRLPNKLIDKLKL